MKISTKSISFSALASACMLLASTNVFAYNTGVCDPNDDPTKCLCSKNLGDHDSCGIVSVSNFDELVRSDNPDDLRQHLGISSTYNSSKMVWEVSVDVTQLNGIGLLLTQSSGGQWQDIEEMHDYLKGLLGIPMSTQFDTLFPPVSFKQNGLYAKYDPATHEFATRIYNNLIYDVVSDNDGQIYFNGEQAAALSPIFYDPIQCSGDAATATAGNFTASQCSTFEEYQNNQPYNCLPGSNGPYGCTGLDQYYPMRDAATSTTKFKANVSFSTFECMAVSGGSLCKQSGPFLFRNLTVRADEVYLNNEYFLPSGNFWFDEDAYEQNTDHVGLLESLVYGVCGDSNSRKGSDNITDLKTKDGTTDPQSPACN